MEIRISSKINKIKNIKISSIWEAVSVWWMKVYNLFFIFLMLVSMGLGIYFWYVGLYIPIMTEQEKNDYIVSKDKSIRFLEEDFNKVIFDIDERVIKHSSQYETKRDIFK